LTKKDEEEMLIGLANLSGYYHTNRLLPDVDHAMEMAVGKLTEGYIKKIRKSVDLIKDVLEKSVENSANLVLNGYPRLINEVKNLMSYKISSNQLETKQLLVTFIEAQRSFMNYNHPHFKEAKMHLGMDSLTHSAGMETSPRPPARHSSHRPPPPPPGRNEEPRIETSVEQADVELHRGWLLLMTTGFRTSSKGVVVVLYMNRLVVYKDFTNFEKSKEMHNLSLEGCVVESSSSILDNKKVRKYFISRPDGKNLYKSEKHIELVAMHDAEDGWTTAFKEIGIYQDISSSTMHMSFNSADKIEKEKEERSSSFLSTSSSFLSTLTGAKKSSTQLSSRPQADETALNDPVNISAKDQLLTLVKKYMEIINITIQDNTPKYIIMVLVKNTIEYAKHYITGDLEEGKTDEDILKLLETDSDIKRRINELIQQKESTKQALDVLSNSNL
jgi:hypothetical protein